MTQHPEDLYQIAADLADNLMPRLRTLIADIGHAPLEPDGKPHGKKASAAPTPWNDAAAGLYFEIHGDARHYETGLAKLMGRSIASRSWSDYQTAEAIRRLPLLLDHAIHNGYEGSPLVLEVVRKVQEWARRVRLFLDEPREGEEPWTKAPGDLCCPYCDAPLALAPGWQRHPDSADVICRACRDEQGGWLRWPPSAWLAVLQQRDAG